jgi:hypothetical protein
VLASLHLKLQFVDRALESQLGRSSHSGLDILVGEGKLRGEEGQGRLVKGVLADNLPIFQIVVEHEEVDEQLDEVLMFLGYAVERILGGVDSFAVLEFEVGAEEFGAEAEKIVFLLVVVGYYPYDLPRDVSVANEMLGLPGKRVVCNEINVVEEHLAPRLLLGTGCAVGTQMGVPLGQRVTLQSPA